MPDARADAAIGAGQHVLAPDELRIAHEALGDEIGMLDEIGAMADDAGNERRALRQLHLLEHAAIRARGTGSTLRSNSCRR